MKRKILFVIESLAGGGAEKILCNVVKYLNKEKYDITVFSVVRTGIYMEEIEKHGKLISILPDYSGLRTSLQRMRYKLRYKEVYSGPITKVYKKYIKDKYDVETAFVEGFATKLVAASPNSHSRKYAWVHTDMMENTHADHVYDSLEEQRKTYLKYDSIIAVSEMVAEAWKLHFGLKDMIQVLYNVVDSEEIYRLSQEDISVRRNEKGLLFVTVGRLVMQKGYDRLLEIVGRLRDDGLLFRVWIIGEGAERKALEETIANWKLEDYVFLLGFHKNPYPYMKQADAFVCSSRAEGFSTAATEALLLKLPVITVQCAGMEELFGGCKCGRIVENETEMLYAAMKDILERPGALGEYREGAKARAREFTVERRIHAVEELLDG